MQDEARRTWVTAGRPFVTYKIAVTVDGRVTVPGERGQLEVTVRETIETLVYGD